MEISSVCIICPSFPNMNCGLGDYVGNLVLQLQSRNWNISVITTDSPKVSREFTGNRPGRLKVLPVIKRWDIRSLFKIKKIVDDSSQQIVHIMYHWHVYNQGMVKGALVSFLPFMLKCGRKKRHRVLISLTHDLMGPYLFPKAGPLRKFALFFMLYFADKITVHGQRYKTDLGRIFPMLAKKIVVIPCGSGIVCDMPLEKIGKDIATDERLETIISFFGYIYPAKGLEYLIEALGLVISRGYRIKLLLIGGSNIDYDPKRFNSYQYKIRSLLASSNLDHCVEWLGFCKPGEVIVNLLRSDICVLPFTDGVNERGSTFNTALSCGLPLITTHGPYAPEKLIHGENIYYVEPCNSQKLAEAILELIDNHELRRKIAKGGKSIYEKQYSWSNITNRTIGLYNEALN